MTLRNMAQRPVLLLEYARGTNPPSKIQANTIPTGLDRISQKAAANIQAISGINESMLGTDSAEVSGIAIRAQAESWRDHDSGAFG